MIKLRRQDKYPDTKWFKWYNANPKNRITTGDCVVRAIAGVTGKDWGTVLLEITQLGLPAGRVYDDPVVYGKYLENLGFIKLKQPRDKSNNLKITGRRFVEQYDGPFVAHIGGHHMICGNHGRIFDTWDSSDGVIGNYWVPVNYVSKVIDKEWKY